MVGSVGRVLARRDRNGHSVLVLVYPARERIDGLLSRDIWFVEVEWSSGYTALQGSVCVLVLA